MFFNFEWAMLRNPITTQATKLAALLTFCSILNPLLLMAVESPDPASFSAALNSALNNDQTLFSMRVHCTDDKGIRSLILHDNGVVIWNGERQARLGPEDRTALLQLLLNAEFPAFSAQYGGKPVTGNTGVADSDAPIIVLCSIDVQADQLEKSTYQDVNGERSDAFMSLAASLLDHIEPLGERGAGAISFADGLEKLKSGKLAPEALTIRILHMPEDESVMGVIIDVSSGRYSRREYRPGIKVGEPQTTIMTSKMMEAVLSALSSADVKSLSANLTTTDTYQMKVWILQHELSVRARPTGAKTAAEPGSESARLEKLAHTLGRLQLPKNDSVE
jgi:hypothetical protein